VEKQEEKKNQEKTLRQIKKKTLMIVVKNKLLHSDGS